MKWRLNNRLVSSLTARSKWRVRVIAETIQALRNRGVPTERLCNICWEQSFFGPFGWPLRPEALCSNCGSLERQRLLKLWLDRNIAMIEDKRILHFAPEIVVASFLRPLALEYVTADIAPGCDLHLNIERIDLPRVPSIIVLCSHVLEHITNDGAALSELYRILSPNGAALLMVPIVEGWAETYEDKTKSDPGEREAYFGQADHVRYYGADFRKRVFGAGFELTEFTS